MGRDSKVFNEGAESRFQARMYTCVATAFEEAANNKSTSDRAERFHIAQDRTRGMVEFRR